MSNGSWNAALYAAGAVMKAVDLVMQGSHQNAICAVRPPGLIQDSLLLSVLFALSFCSDSMYSTALLQAIIAAEVAAQAMSSRRVSVS